MPINGEIALDYVSFVSAAGGVVVALFAAMTYYRIKADDSPTIHVRFLEVIKDDVYHLVLEIHPGKHSARCNMLIVKGGRVSLAESCWERSERTIIPMQALSSSCEVDIYVPSAIARDSGSDLSLILSMNNTAVVYLYCRQGWYTKKLRTSVTASMAAD